MVCGGEGNVHRKNAGAEGLPGEFPVVRRGIVAGRDRDGRFKNDIELGARTLKIFPRFGTATGSIWVNVKDYWHLKGKKGPTDDLKFITSNPGGSFKSRLWRISGTGGGGTPIAPLVEISHQTISLSGRLRDCGSDASGMH